jgi:hypothetical protein
MQPAAHDFVEPHKTASVRALPMPDGNSIFNGAMSQL